MSKMSFRRARLFGRVHPVERAVGLPGDAKGAHGHALVLPEKCRRDVGAVLPQLHLHLDAALLELALDELEGVSFSNPVSLGSLTRLLSRSLRVSFGWHMSMGPPLRILGATRHRVSGGTGRRKPRTGRGSTGAEFGVPHQPRPPCGALRRR